MFVGKKLQIEFHKKHVRNKFTFYEQFTYLVLLIHCPQIIRITIGSLQTYSGMFAFLIHLYININFILISLNLYVCMYRFFLTFSRCKNNNQTTED